MRIHFIAIGGAAMHNLAIALHKKGDIVTGSDDEIFNPSRARLAFYGLLPESIGWNQNRINRDLDAIILGMHARADNPELLKAKELGLKIYSYPEFLYEHAKNKTRIVIGGSHGKTTITAMVLHVLKHAGIETDYMVGAQLDGFEVMVRLSDTAKFMVFEGDEYLTSPLDLRPKFHLYRPHIALISGIAWDHINVFPTFENYVDQFRIFISLIEKGGSLVYCECDEVLNKLVNESLSEVHLNPYNLPEYHISEGKTYLNIDSMQVPLEIFGEHNLLNLNGAHHICKEMKVSDETFYNAIKTFKGASNRLELIAKDRFN
jgi:UDP-N-acetylmuramate: L-alanyl-gamma-D-glutamyl-meso-diaminopimelate ligase